MAETRYPSFLARATKSQAKERLSRPEMAELPVELWMRVFSFLGIGRAHFNDRERQHALTLLARVSPTFNSAASALLYASCAVLNAGRASLLLDVLSKNPEYADMAQRFAWITQNGLVDSALLCGLLKRLSNLRRLEMTSQLVQGAKIAADIGDIVKQLPIREFACAAPSTGASLYTVVPILQALPDLKHLEVQHLVAWKPLGGSTELFEKPAFDLDSLDVRLITPPFVTPGSKATLNLEMLLGGTKALKSFSLKHAGWNEALSDSSDVLLRQSDSLRSLELDGPQSSKLIERMLPELRNLEHLAIGGADADETPYLHHMRHERLLSITLLDRGLAEVVTRAIIEDRLPALQQLTVVNLKRSHELIETLEWACEARDVKLVLERRFDVERV